MAAPDRVEAVDHSERLGRGASAPSARAGRPNYGQGQQLVIFAHRWRHESGQLYRSGSKKRAGTNYWESADCCVAVASGESGRGGQAASSADRDERITALVVAHLRFVWQLLRRLGLDRAQADDVAQEVFVVAWRRLDRVHPDRERAYLYGVATRLAANARRRRLRARESSGPVPRSPEAPTLPPDEAADLTQRLVRLDAALAELPDALRRVIVLMDAFELEVGEVAKLESIPRGTVASRLRRARQLFRAKLKRRGLDEELP